MGFEYQEPDSVIPSSRGFSEGIRPFPIGIVANAQAPSGQEHRLPQGSLTQSWIIGNRGYPGADDKAILQHLHQEDAVVESGRRFGPISQVDLHAWTLEIAQFCFADSGLGNRAQQWLDQNKAQIRSTADLDYRRTQVREEATQRFHPIVIWILPDWRIQTVGEIQESVLPIGDKRRSHSSLNPKAVRIKIDAHNLRLVAADQAEATQYEEGCRSRHPAIPTEDQIRQN